MKRYYSDIMDKVYVTYILWVYFLYTTDFKSVCNIKKQYNNVLLKELSCLSSLFYSASYLSDGQTIPVP